MVQEGAHEPWNDQWGALQVVGLERCPWHLKNKRVTDTDLPQENRRRYALFYIVFLNRRRICVILYCISESETVYVILYCISESEMYVLFHVVFLNRRRVILYCISESETYVLFYIVFLSEQYLRFDRKTIRNLCTFRYFGCITNMAISINTCNNNLVTASEKSVVVWKVVHIINFLKGPFIWANQS